MTSPSEDQVWISGIGLITPLGIGIADTWNAVCAGRSALREIEGFDAARFASRMAAEMPVAFDARIKDLYRKRYERMTKRYARYVLAATTLALHDARLPRHLDDAPTMLYLGTGTSGYDNDRTAADVGSEAPGVWDVLKRMPCAVASILSIEHRINGPAFTVSTACSSGATAMGLGFDAIRSGAADRAIVGGYDFAVTPGAQQGFGALLVLSRRNDQPEAACRPFDRDRDGMVLGDAVAVLVLERATCVAARGVRPYACVAGYAATSEASSLVEPGGGGRGMAETMRAALRRAALDPTAVDYVNAHGTGTRANDACESRAIRLVFGAHADRIAVSSQKSMLGHSLGGSGAVEAAISAVALSQQMIPPTLNWTHADADCNLDYVPGAARRAPLRALLSNSFAFGGHNCSLALTSASSGAR